MKRVSIAVACVWWMVIGVVVQAEAPANPKANPKAVALLDYLTQLSLRADKRLLSGQFSGSGKKASLAPCEKVLEVTGHSPAIIGVDYIDQGGPGLETATPNAAVIAYAKQGGLVTISTHMYNPANPNGGGLRDRGVDMKVLLEPGSETYARWMTELDTVAAGLSELQDAGVVVLWRPFHEMNGGWFWWGAQDPEVFKAVWRQVFDYFTETKGLNNLLWLYGPNHGEKTADYYPGDTYVDIVGLDAYTDFVDPQHIRGYDAVAQLPKPFAFTEFGPHGSKDPPGDYDYLRFLEGVQTHFPKAVFFLSWSDKWGLMKNQNTKALLDHPWVVNREDLPAPAQP